MMPNMILATKINLQSRFQGSKILCFYVFCTYEGKLKATGVDLTAQMLLLLISFFRAAAETM